MKSKSLAAFAVRVFTAAAVVLFLNFSQANALPASPCTFDIGCYYLGTFGGNDERDAIETASGESELFLIEKSDEPGQTEFLFNGSSADPAGLYEGTWQYVGPLVDPVVFMSVKAGPQYALYEYVPSRSSGFWSTADLVVGVGSQPGVSHISFFGIEGVDVPEPATLFLLGSGLLGFAGFWRKAR